MKVKRLYLVRHGAIIEVNGKRYIGQTEAPLSEYGVEQARALRNWFQRHEFTRVLCSDLTRSLRTAKIILGARRIRIEAHPELREISLGEWDGVSFREIEAKYPEEFKARGTDIEHWRPPGGESFADCRQRVLAFLHHELPRSEGDILLVGHAGVNRLILCDALGLPTANLMHVGQDYGAVSIVEFGLERARVQLLNFVPPSSATPLETDGRRKRRTSAS
ncbi:MAG TPA: alpha-ribazole phosphatase [Candidatus Acidoferrales bacterium]|nr:alpha-ribazole phosphatase [Candidatus Acidoferrales bacterium]